ncbi:MAG TPA: sodium/solute symporter [Spirochaetota bacterium]|nr:sodium/solute symporter [Spirochaetota bacterium]
MTAIIFVCVFMLLMIGIGLWGMRKTSSLNDFFLGGRSIGPWVSAVAYGTTYFSAVLFIGFAGKLGWGFGLSSILIALGNAFLGSFAAWLILGKRTRVMTQNLDVITMPEFLQERYGANWFKLISAAIIFIFLLPYCASIFKGLGHLFESTFSISYDTALLIMIIITAIYLILGGYFAITVTDFIQGIIMIFGCAAMVAVLTSDAGGISNVISMISTKYAEHLPEAKKPSMLILGSLIFMTSFGTWGLPQMVQKFYAIKNEKVIMKAAIATTIFALIISLTAYFVGSMSHIFFDTLPMNGTKPAFDRIVPDMLNAHLPQTLMALILLLVLSASMSTLSSLILVSSSAVAIDMYKGHVNPNISKRKSLAMMRFLCLVFMAFAFFIARYEFAFIVTLMSLSWGVVAGSFLAPYLYGLYWKGATKAGVLAGMITGFTLAIVLFYKMGQDYSPLASSIAMIVPFAVVPVVSIFTKPPRKEIVEKAFKGF